MTRSLLPWLAGVLFACSAVPPGAMDGGAGDGGADGGGLDASLPRLELTFERVNLPMTAARLGLASDGTTLYANSTIGSVAAGTLRGVIVASADEGRSWAVRSFSGAAVLGDTPDGGLLGQQGQQLLRSLDGARTFSPTGTIPSSVAATPAPWVTLSADGALWVTSRDAAPVVQRSLDEGATFADVPVPAGTTRLDPCACEGAEYVALRNQTELVRSDGAGFTSLGTIGTVSGPMSCVALATGTVLVTANLGSGARALRLPSGGSTWDDVPADAVFRFAVGPGTVVRVLTNGRVDESTDDGASWTPRVSSSTGVTVADVAFAGSTVVGLTNGTARLPAGATSWEVVLDPGLPGADVVDFAFATDPPSMALLLTTNLQRTLFVAEDGATWRRGVTLPQGAATALALSPDGRQAFLGALDGTYRVYADAGTELVINSRIETAAGLRDTNPIRQAAWERAGGSFLMVTTANDADTAGSVWQLTPDLGDRSWLERRPFTTTTAPAVRPGGYHALAIAADAPPPALTRSMVVSLRSNYTTNGFLNYVLTRQPVLETVNFWWLQDTPPVGFFGALAASCNGAWGQGLAVLWPENRLWVGRFADALREVPLSQGLGEVRVVRFDRSGRLWLAGSGGLWRTTAPVTLD